MSNATFGAQLGLTTDATSPLEWFADHMRRSGITTHMVDHAGITLTPQGFAIPYHDLHGEPTHQTMLRKIDETDGKVCKVSGIGKPHLAYWPRVIGVDHTELLRDLSRPLWITEGEKKALCLQSELLRQGVPGSVVAVNGVTHLKALERELNKMPWQMGDHCRRAYIVYDWHPRESDNNPMVRAEERKLYRKIVELGGSPIVVRWPAGFADPEQKIDDWLVAGGDLAQAIETSERLALIPSLPMSHDFFNEHYAKYPGGVIDLRTGDVLTTRAFCDYYSHLNHRGDKGRVIYHAREWLDWGDVPTLTGACFQPVSILGGQHDRIIGTEFNLFVGWEPMEEGDVTPFKDFIAHLFERPPERHAALSMMAHMLQHPDQPISTYLALFSTTHGVGKGLLKETLQGVLGRYATLGSAQSWVGEFNGDWRGKLLVFTDELALTRQGQRIAMANKIKACCANDTILINPKGKDQVTLPNYIRYFFSCNDAASVYVDQEDRRAFCVRAENKLTWGTEYGTWMRANLKQIRHYLAHYDTTGWDPKGDAIRTQAKAEVLAENAGELGEFADWVAGDGQRKVWSGRALVAEWEALFNEPYHAGVVHLCRRLRLAGVLGESRRIKIGMETQRVSPDARHVEWFTAATPADIGREVERVKYA